MKNVSSKFERKLNELNPKLKENPKVKKMKSLLHDQIYVFTDFIT
jgi:hypothetical protein